MKSAWFIMKLWQTGNVGSNNIKKIDANPEEGYSSYNEAKNAMFKLYEEGNWDLRKSSFHTFSIMELFW